MDGVGCSLLAGWLQVMLQTVQLEVSTVWRNAGMAIICHWDLDEHCYDYAAGICYATEASPQTTASLLIPMLLLRQRGFQLGC